MLTNPNSASQAATQHPIDEAIGLLSAEAESIRECHTPGCDRNDWTGESEAKAAHDNMLRVAAALSKLRAPVAEPRLEWSAKALYDAIKDVLLNHRLSNWVDEDGEFFPLVDHLCSKDAKTTESGEFEIALICDAIYNDVLTKSAPVADERAALEWYAEHVAGCRKLGPDGDAARQALDKDGGERARAALASAPVTGEAQQPDDIAVDNFAAAMKAKLAKKRDEGRYGWQSTSHLTLSSMLYEHMYKGDPLDVGNLAMMLHQNGKPIELPEHARRKDAAPQASAEPTRILFPTHLRKMWSGGEVQAWLDQHQGVTPPPATAKGSLARYRQWKAEQDQATASCTCPSGDGSLRHPCPAHSPGKPPAPSQSTDKEQA